MCPYFRVYNHVLLKCGVLYDCTSVGEYLLFESEDHPGYHVGVIPNGDAKAPQSTGRGRDGQFTPKVIDESPFSRLD